MIELHEPPICFTKPTVVPEAGTGFVPFPTDVQRSTTVGYEQAFASARSSGQFVNEILLGALGALLFRYTQQELIALQLRAYGPDNLKQFRLLKLPVAPELPIGALISTAAESAEDADALRVQLC